MIGAGDDEHEKFNWQPSSLSLSQSEEFCLVTELEKRVARS